METKTIARVNDVLIVVNKENELVPLKPICEAIGVASNKQIEKIKEHPILNSVVTLGVSTGSDGKQYEMTCLPLKYIFGWLFTINPDNVKEEARETVIKYQGECYNALYEYFSEYAEFVEVRSKAIEVHLDTYQRLQKNFSEARVNMDEAKKKLNEVKSYNFERYKADKKQFKLEFLSEENNQQ